MTETSRQLRDFAELIRGPRCGCCGRHLTKRTVAGYVRKEYSKAYYEMVPLCVKCLDETEKV